MTTNATNTTMKTVCHTPRSVEEKNQLITWTDYQCGAALLGSGTNTPDSQPDLILHGVALRGPITHSYLTDLADDLLCLANDPQVRALLPPGKSATECSPLRLAWDAMDGDEQAFAAVITLMHEKVDPAYRGMADTGLALLSLACLGESLPEALRDGADDMSEEATIARTWKAAYHKGFHTALDTVIAYVKATPEDRAA